MIHSHFPVLRGVSGLILSTLATNGEIISLHAFAHQNGLTPCWVNRQAHRLESQGLVTLERQSNRRGHPCLVKPGPEMGPLAEEIHGQV
jgi:hypothetical protein